MKITRLAWDSAFRSKGKIFTNPDREVIELAKVWKRGEIKKILDLGCGSGRHVVFLSKKGFNVYGIDIAKAGIKIAKEWLNKEKLKAKLKVGDIYEKLPYDSNFFDAIICIRTLNHGKITWIRRCIKEMYRVLKEGGYVFITVRKYQGKKKIPKDKLYGIKWIAPRTYIILGGDEKGIPHFRFNKKILKREIEKYFKIEKLWINENNYYCLLGKCTKTNR